MNSKNRQTYKEVQAKALGVDTVTDGAVQASLSRPGDGWSQSTQLKGPASGVSWVQAAHDYSRHSSSGPGSASPSVQHAARSTTNADIHQMAQEGLQGPASSLPHLATIQRSFGRHNVRNVQAHIGGPAATANEGMGSLGYAKGEELSFKEAPDLHLAAHEAAHSVQQRNGVQLAGGVGRQGDVYEQHADAVANDVVQGRSAEGRLSAGPTGAQSSTATQAKAVQHEGTDYSADQEIEIDLGFAGVPKIKGVKGKDSLSATVTIPKTKYPEDAAFEQRFSFPIVFAPGVSGYAAVTVSGGVAQQANITIKGTKTGEGDATAWSLEVSGKAPMKGEVKAALSLGVSVGIGIADLLGEVAAIPTASLEYTPNVTGTLNWSKEKGVSGSIGFGGEVKAELSVELAARLLYDVFWEKNPIEFAKYTFGKWIIGTAGMSVDPKIKIPGGPEIEAKEPYIKWGKSPKPVKTGGRDPGEFKSEYEREQERLAAEIKLLKEAVTTAQLLGTMDDVRKAQKELNAKQRHLMPQSLPKDDADKLMDKYRQIAEKQRMDYIEGKRKTGADPLPSWREIEKQVAAEGKGMPVLVHDGTGSSEIGPET